MAGFLHIELFNTGINFKVMTQSSGKILIQDECCVANDAVDLSGESSSLFSAAVKSAAQMIDLSSCSQAVIIVNDACVHFRNLTLPFETKNKITQVLPFELEPLLPLSSVPYLSDFHLLSLNRSPGLILSASLPEETVEDYFETLKEFKIRPVAVMPRGYTAAVCFMGLKNAIDQFMFAHICEGHLTLTVIHKGIPCLVRHFGIDSLTGKEICEQIRKTIAGFQQRTGIDEGFELYISSDDEPEARQTEIYQAFDEMLEDRDIRPNRFRIESEGLICQVTPQKKIKWAFDFCKGRFKRSSFLEEHKTRILVTAVLAVLTVTTFLVSMNIENSRLSEKVAKLDAQATQIYELTFPGKKVQENVYLEMKAQVRAARKNRSKPGAEISGGSIKVLDMLSEISRKIDPATDTEVTRFLYSQNRLILSGTTLNFNSVNQMKVRLENSGIFKKVTISSAASDKKNNRINFKFIIDV